MINFKKAAEHKIAQILQQLEKDTGQLVDNVQILSREISDVSDERRIFQKVVVIKLTRLPGHEWDMEQPR